MAALWFVLRIAIVGISVVALIWVALRSKAQPVVRELGHREQIFRPLGVRRAITALLGSSGWALLTYVEILGRRYQVPTFLLLGALAAYAWAFWFFVVRNW